MSTGPRKMPARALCGVACLFLVIVIATGARAAQANAQVSLLNPRPVRLTSNAVTLAWELESGYDQIRVFLGPEPAQTENGPLPDQMLVATLPGDATGYTLGKLAAAVDAFIRVEAHVLGALSAARNIHVRTPGGPRAELASAVREVHLYAPNILQVVLENKRVHSYTLAHNWHDGGLDEVAGNTGPAWQAGPWTVTRRDGRALQVTETHRHSFPVAQPYYELGYGANTHANLLDVDHHIFLVLEEPVGNRDILHVTGPFETDFLLPFSDRYLETPVIQLNQVGYSPIAKKRWAYVSGWMGDGGPLSLRNFPGTAEVLADPEDRNQPRPVVLNGLSITVRAAHDGDAGGEVRQINLAAVPRAEGVFYRIRVPGVGVSWPTQVSETAVFKAFFTIARGLYFNRWGRDLQPHCTEWAPRPPDHPTVYVLDPEPPVHAGFYPEDTPKQVERPLQGGHHDAGDFDIRLLHTEIAMSLMRTYEMNPKAFTDGQLNIPESGNGIPDLLDEALWSLAAWERLQESDGGVRAGVESYRHPWGIYYADQDPLPYWVHSRYAPHTARVAGLFAQMSRLVAPFDPDHAEDLQNRAVRAFNYVLASGAVPIDHVVLAYPAGELYRLTSESAYGAVFETVWEAANKFGNGLFDKYSRFLYMTSVYTRDNPPAIIDHLLGFLGSDRSNPLYRAVANRVLGDHARVAVNELGALHAHRNGRPSRFSPGWGQGTAVGEYMIRIYGLLAFRNLPPDSLQEYFDAMSVSADYVLGANPAGMVWISGLGSRYPREPLHLDSLAFTKDGKGPMPGIPVFGPVPGLPAAAFYDYGIHVLHPAFEDHPLMRRYVDIRTFVNTNEFDIRLMARHTRLFAMLIADGMTPPESWLPGGPEHRNTLPPREGIPHDQRKGASQGRLRNR